MNEASGAVRHFLRDDDLTHAEQEAVLARALEMKAEPFRYRPFEGPRSVAILTDKPTLRTQVSFHAGIAELGGNPILVDGRLAGIGVRESVPDSARVLGRQVAAIVWRTGAQDRIDEMSAYAGVPVVNALTDAFHPCQVLADWLTIREHKGDLAGLTFSYVGDAGNNMAQSYVLAGAVAGMHIRIGAPEGYHPAPEIIARAEEIARGTGGSLLVTDSVAEAVTGVDVVATDTWVSMGHETENEIRQQVFAPYAVTSELLARADADAIAMHCLPAYRGKEIAAEVIDGPRAVVWDEAENRRHAQKAILHFLDEESNGRSATRRDG